MSDANRLRNEIKYLSVLIQKHRESSGATTTKIPESSKYTWSTGTANTARHSYDEGSASSSSHSFGSTNLVKTGGKRTFQATRMSQSPAKIVRAAEPLSSATMARKTGVAFDKKFKWTKDSTKPPLQKSVIPHNAVLQKPQAKSVFNPTTPPIQSESLTTNISSTSNTGPARFVAKSSLVNSRYKYHKVAGGAELLNRANRNMRELHGFSTRRQKPGEVSRKWHLNRPNLKYRAQNLSTNWVSTSARKNPYKLNRIAKPYQYSSSIASRVGAHRPTRSPRRDQKKKPADRSQQRNKETSTHITLSKVALEGFLRKHSMTQKQVLASRAVAKSHETTRFKKQERKRQHCLYFGRFGKCMRGDSCKFIHDPSRVAVCTRFLRGTCRNQTCHFSHKVEKEKIPLCLFFLRGKCSVPCCPYLHVFLGKDAPVCQRFASTGYCPNADKCTMQHIKCCPDFYQNGSCSKGRSCEMQHFRIHKLSEKNEMQKEEQNESDKPGISKTKANLMANACTTPAPSSCPDFLSLNVDSPEPMNKPIKREPSLIKPRISMLKAKISSSQ